MAKLKEKDSSKKIKVEVSEENIELAAYYLAGKGLSHGR